MAKTTFSGPVQSLGGFQDENGNPISGGTPGGTTGQVQVNNSGSFGGISEGTSGQVLTSTGTGTAPTFQAVPSPTSLNITTGTIKLDGNFPTGSNNVVMGNTAGDALTTGGQNTLIGDDAGGALTTGSRNVCIGNGAGNQYTNAPDNVIIGAGAQASAGAGASQSVIIGSGANPSSNPSRTVVIGYQAMSGASSDADNSIAIGYQALQNSNSTNNTCLGDQAGDSITTGQNNTCLGHDADASAATANNEITLGDNQVATLRCQVTSITALSDARDKKDVEDANIGLDFINDLRPVKFVWDTRDGAKKDIKEVGFIAQELDEVQQKHGVEDYLQLILKNNPDKLEASPGKLIPVLVQAIKDLKKEIDELKKA